MLAPPGGLATSPTGNPGSAPVYTHLFVSFSAFNAPKIMILDICEHNQKTRVSSILSPCSRAEGNLD